MNRRDFLAVLSGMALAGCALNKEQGEHAQGAQGVGKPRFNVFSKMFQSPVTASPEALCDLMAAAGFDGVQWTVRKGGHATPENAKVELPRLVKISEARGLKVETICTAITDGNAPASLELAKVAADCGVCQFRCGYYFYDERNETFRQSVDRFQRGFDSLATLGERCAIRVAYQNHSTWGPAMLGSSLWDLYFCLQNLNPQYIGVEFDPMHAYCENYKSWRTGFARLVPWIAAIDLKDFYWAPQQKNPKEVAKCLVPAGEGVVPWAQLVQLMAQYKIDPMYIIHFEHKFDKTDLLKTVRQELVSFKRLLKIA